MAGPNPGGWIIAVGWLAAMPVTAPAQESPETVAGLAAELEQRVVSSGGAESVTTRALLLVEGSARVESIGEPSRAGYAEYQLHDFVRGRVSRVLPNDRIYFEGPRSKAAASQAFLEGWAPRPPDLSVRMIPLKTDELAGVPASLELMEYRVGTGAPAYAFVWSGVPRGRLPLRVAYTQRGGQTVLLSYRRVEPRAVDASSLSVPEGFVNLSPF
ncbi:MAG: hypothetical protein ACOYXU_04760 [Nitrospirota bacterium]